MKTTALVAFFLAAFVTLAAAQDAIVYNDCPFTVFLQSFPYDGSKPGPFTVMPAGSSKPYHEKFRDGGSTIKLSNKRTLASPLFSAYTNQQTMIYYSLDQQYGNPFIKYRNKLIPNNPACERFNCGPGNENCYSYAGSKVFGCAKPVNVTTTLCANLA